MTVRFNLAGPPDEVREARARIERSFGPRLSTDTDLLNAPATLAAPSIELPMPGSD